MVAQATKSEALVIRASDQRLRNIIEIQDPQNIQDSQSTISNSLDTTLKVTEKNTPIIKQNIATRSTDNARSKPNLISLPQKVRTPVSKIPMLITKDTNRNNLDQAVKKTTSEQKTRISPLT